jgi:hypothetical protein
MSRGLGKMQRDVLRALVKCISENQDVLPGVIPVVLKSKLFGRRRGKGFFADGKPRTVLACDWSRTAHLNRALASLLRRGLIRVWSEEDYPRIIDLTEAGLVEAMKCQGGSLRKIPIRDLLEVTLEALTQ